jgi:UDP-perosamine 4-acetyltransferase
VTRVLLLGAGGHAKVLVELLGLLGGYEIDGLLDPREELWGAEVAGIRVLGGDELIAARRQAGVSAGIVALGGVRDNAPRRRLFALLAEQGLAAASAVHPAAIVSPSATLGAGPSVMALAVVGAGARLGDNVLVNTAAIIEHDCTIGSHAHVASGACLAGGVTVGEGAHVGLGARVNEGVTVGAGAVVGSGAVVVGDVEPGSVVVGVPARAVGA